MKKSGRRLSNGRRVVGDGECRCKVRRSVRKAASKPHSLRRHRESCRKVGFDWLAPSACRVETSPSRALSPSNFPFAHTLSIAVHGMADQPEIYPSDVVVMIAP